MEYYACVFTFWAQLNSCVCTHSEYYASHAFVILFYFRWTFGPQFILSTYMCVATERYPLRQQISFVRNSNRHMHVPTAENTQMVHRVKNRNSNFQQRRWTRCDRQTVAQITLFTLAAMAIECVDRAPDCFLYPRRFSVSMSTTGNRGQNLSTAVRL